MEMTPTKPRELHDPGRDEFLACAREGSPALIHGVVSAWPCSRLWSDAYLRDRLHGRKFLVNESPDGLFGIQSSRMLDSQGLCHISFDEFLDRVHTCGDGDEPPAERGPVFYMQQKPAAETFPELLPDVGHASFVDLATLSQLNIWIGQRGSRIPMHYDSFDNLLVQVRGRKSVRLYPPSQTPYLYPGLDGVDFASHVDPEQPDLQRYPLFARAAGAMDFTLETGEMLYLPPFWWHSIRALSNANISINYWYDTAFGLPRQPLQQARDLLRLTLSQSKALPPVQLDVMRAMLRQAADFT
ncbi:cupin-like domain-containing protein [Mitsuaria sp. WAJ17]|uniref:cupin-like domain-containing protein n=1 Tax=Mitsuaria sp. WAJ17 TaxID=2761452 RepID=UPI001600736D|nr:cupin-like domain-containing protein [Mitsuaria sp. WAJ17]MBB2487887.1 cupin-like domain-containing protein [Mitsuaria sp. WAJ17]